VSKIRCYTAFQEGAPFEEEVDIIENIFIYKLSKLKEMLKSQLEQSKITIGEEKNILNK
jgi:hypothetical protein